MADTVKPERLALWQYGFNLFGAHFKEWLSLAVWFCALTIIAQVLFYDPAIKQFAQSMSEGAPNRMTQADIDRFVGVLIHMAPGFVAVLAIEFVQSYRYAVLFLQRQTPVIGAPVFTVKRFFWWWWNLILMVALGAAMGGLLAGLPVGISVALSKFNPYLLPIGVFIGIVGFCFSLFVVYRLTFVANLAICNVDHAFKTSWRITKGNCWRIFGNTFVMLLITMILFGVATIAEKVITELLFTILPGMFSAFSGPDTKPQQTTILRLFGSAAEQPYGPMGVYLDLIFQSINVCFMLGIGRAFLAAATHIIYQEHQVAPPIATPVVVPVAAPIAPPNSDGT